MVTSKYFIPRMQLSTNHKLQVASFILTLAVTSCRGFPQFGSMGLVNDIKPSPGEFVDESGFGNPLFPGVVLSKFSEPNNNFESLISLINQPKPLKLDSNGIGFGVINTNDNSIGGKIGEPSFLNFGDQAGFKRGRVDELNQGFLQQSTLGERGKDSKDSAFFIDTGFRKLHKQKSLLKKNIDYQGIILSPNPMILQGGQGVRLHNILPKKSKQANNVDLIPQVKKINVLKVRLMKSPKKSSSCACAHSANEIDEAKSSSISKLKDNIPVPQSKDDNNYDNNDYFHIAYSQKYDVKKPTRTL